MITIGEHRTYLATIHQGTAVGRACDAAWRSVADYNNLAPQWCGHEDVGHALAGAWAAALNSRRQFEWTHFCAIRGDVKPWGDDWLSVLLDEMRRVGVHALFMAMADPAGDGVTNCAVESMSGGLNTGPFIGLKTRRLTMHEIDPLPDMTFGAVETGHTGCRLLCGAELMVVDFRRDWVENALDHLAGRTVVRSFVPEQPMPGAAAAKLTMPEDWAIRQYEVRHEPPGWALCRYLHGLGAPYAATKRLAVGRLGLQEFGNMSAWGSTKECPWHETSSCDSRHETSSRG